MDYMGGQGNGSAWYCNDFNAELLKSSSYTAFVNKPLASIDPNAIKQLIAQSEPTAEAATLLNYLKWLYDLTQVIA